MSIELQFGHDDVLALDNDRRSLLERLGLFEATGAYARAEAGGTIRIDSGTPAAVGSLSASVTPSRAVRAIVTADLDVECHVWSSIGDYLVIELLVDGTPHAAQLVWANSAASERISLTRVWTLDLAKDVTVALELQASVAGGATNTYDIQEHSGMIVQTGIAL